MKIDGACHCGEITYQAEIDPDTVTICHCTDCQTLSGTAFRVAVPAMAGNITFLTGSPSSYIKTAESGNKRAQVFCGACATQIYSSEPGDDPPVYMLRVGTIKQRDKLPPKSVIWARSAQSWITGMGQLPKSDRQ